MTAAADRCPDCQGSLDGLCDVHEPAHVPLGRVIAVSPVPLLASADPAEHRERGPDEPHPGTCAQCYWQWPCPTAQRESITAMNPGMEQRVAAFVAGVCPDCGNPWRGREHTCPLDMLAPPPDTAQYTATMPVDGEQPGPPGACCEDQPFHTRHERETS